MQLMIYLCRLIEVINGCPRLLVLDISLERRSDTVGNALLSGYCDPHLPRRLEVLRSDAVMVWDSLLWDRTYQEMWSSSFEEMCPNLKYLELTVHTPSSQDFLGCLDASTIQASFHHES